MANIKYFADKDGQTFELTSVFHDGMESGALPITEGVYRGAGKYWAAVVDGQVVALRSMAGYPEAFLPDLGRKRMTDRAMRELARENDRRFHAWRSQCREELAEIGELVSGTCSGGLFYPRDVEAAARVMATRESAPKTEL